MTHVSHVVSGMCEEKLAFYNKSLVAAVKSDLHDLGIYIPCDCYFYLHVVDSLGKCK